MQGIPGYHEDVVQTLGSIDYSLLMREALRDVPRQVLRRVAASGLPGDHHFFVTFRTDHPRVNVPLRLRQQHPMEMTVVIQHQFSGLLVDDGGFSVTLRFGGRPEQIVVPFDALTAFVDPAAEFGLRFEREEEAPSVVEADAGQKESGSPNEPVGEAERRPNASSRRQKADGKVVSIGNFRKR